MSQAKAISRARRRAGGAVAATPFTSRWRILLCDECRSVLGSSHVLTCDEHHLPRRFCQVACYDTWAKQNAEAFGSRH